MIRLLTVIGLFDREEKRKSIEQLFKELWELQEVEADILIEIAIYYYDAGDPNEALTFLKKAADIYNQLGHDENESQILELIGDVYRDIDPYKSIEYYNQASEAYYDMDSAHAEAILKKIEEIKQNLQIKDEKLPEEIEAVLEVRESEKPGMISKVDYEDIGYKLDEIINFLDESSIYSTYQKLSNPLKQLQEAYEMSRSIGDKKGEAALLLIMGDLCLKNEKTKNSFNYFQESLDIYRKIDDKKGEAIANLMIGTLCFLLGSTEKSMLHIKNSLDILKYIDDKELLKAARSLLKTLYE